MSYYVFVVGPDGTGKTEISKRLAHELKVPRYKAPNERENWDDGTFLDSLWFDRLLPSYVRAEGAFAPGMVFDRGYACEHAYSVAFGRATHHTMIRKIDAEWAEIEAKHVLCLRRDYLRCRPDELVPATKLKEIEAAYLRFYAEVSRCDRLVLFVDDFDDDIDRQMRYLLPFLKGS